MARKNEQGFSSSVYCPSLIAAARWVFLAGISAYALAHAFSQSQVSPAGPSIFGSGPIGNMNQPSPQERARRKLLAAQKLRQQKEMAADVAKLLMLANELKEEAQDGSGNPDSDAEKARQIEKLARRVETLMREVGEV
jgi:hypothetical protein